MDQKERVLLKYIDLCFKDQQKSYRIIMTWGWVNDDRNVIFGWTIPLKGLCV